MGLHVNGTLFRLTPSCVWPAVETALWPKCQKNDGRAKKTRPVFGSLPPLCPDFNAEVLGEKGESTFSIAWQKEKVGGKQIEIKVMNDQAGEQTEWGKK